jgi:hypothetical protein
MPQASLSGSKLSVRNGISISIVHPISLLVGRQELVAPPLVADPPIRLRIETGDAHEERLAVVDDPHLGLLGRRPSVVGILLNESVRRDGAPPRPLVEPAVELDHFFIAHPHGHDRPAVSGRRRAAGLLGDEGRRPASESDRARDNRWSLHRA